MKKVTITGTMISRKKSRSTSSATANPIEDKNAIFVAA
jgi:hypothetical protein